MDKELQGYFEELVAEFNSVRTKIMSDVRIAGAFRLGVIVETGKNRYYNEHGFRQHICFDTSILAQFLRFHIRSYDCSKKIFEYVVSKKLWPGILRSYEEDFISMPSISYNIISGFLVRNFEVNDYSIEITKASFEQTLTELEAFFNNDTIEITTYLSLYGASGDGSSIKISDSVCIKSASSEIAREFGLNYSDFGNHYTEMYEGDYVLEIKYQVPKKDFMHFHKYEKELLDSYFHLPLLTLTGNIEYGKVIRVSSAWPVVTIKAPDIIWGKLNRYDFHYKSDYYISHSDEEVFKNVAVVLDLVDFSKLDKRIIYSIERLKKSKSSKDINDRVVELALAYEYLINTSGSEVTLRLALKAIRLLYNDNNDEEIYHKLKKFYDLRSQIMHGNKKIERTSLHDEIINYAERVIQKMTLRMMWLNKAYTFKEIGDALEKSLYIAKPLEELLNQK